MSDIIAVYDADSDYAPNYLYATSRNNKLNAMTTPDFPSSPPWSASAKRAIVIILLAILALALYRI
ncbi:MAG: hypothetical protein GY805_19835, partial [Chloroflexi bacterium]|nr:hypothetical protein [Chloroflexota bacterium]